MQTILAVLQKLSNHLNQLMSNERITASELGRRINLPASTIKKIRNCDTPNPTVATLLPIARYFSLTLSQLVGDETMPFYGVYGSLQKIPVLSWEEAIHYPNTDFNASRCIHLDPPESPLSYALIVNEQSLENLPEDTLLIINPELKPLHLDLVLMHKTGLPKPCLKQWIDNEGEIYLKSLISGCPFSTLNPEHVVLGVVTETRKRSNAHK
jgi:transcriptional regulator with XRE-family HTH domain